MLNKVEKYLPWSVLLFAPLALISTSVSQILLYLSVVIFFILILKKKINFEYPVFFIPIIFFAFFSLLSAFFSYLPIESIKDMRELFLYLSIPLIYSVLKKKKDLLKYIPDILFYVVLISSAYSLYQFVLFLIKKSGPKRVTGFESHYMTQAGLMMMIGIFSLTLLITTKKFRNKKIYLLFFLSSTILILTLTRSAWLGFGVALLFLLIKEKPILVSIIPVVIFLLYLVSPAPIKNRLLSLANFKDTTFQDRITMIKKGCKIIKDKPIFGVGPNMIKPGYVYKIPKYKIKTNNNEKEKPNVHLHNNIIQLWAERGTLTIICWFWFLGLFFIRILKFKPENQFFRAIKWGAVFITIAFFTAGLFEYNFGDIEPKILFLMFITLPFIGEKKHENKKHNK